MSHSRRNPKTQKRSRFPIKNGLQTPPKKNQLQKEPKKRKQEKGTRAAHAHPPKKGRLCWRDQQNMLEKRLNQTDSAHYHFHPHEICPHLELERLSKCD